jgi:hypothetical protein
MVVGLQNSKKKKKVRQRKPILVLLRDSTSSMDFSKAVRAKRLSANEMTEEIYFFDIFL